MQAIFSGDVEKFDALTREHGVKPDAVVEPDQWNYLHRALVSVAQPADARMVRHLIERGVPVDARDRYGNTPLYYAAQAKNVAAMQALLDAGADVNTKNEEEVTPLRELLVRKPLNLEAVELLLSHGADMHQANPGGVSIKEYAKKITQGDRKLLDLFEKYDHK